MIGWSKMKERLPDTTPYRKLLVVGVSPKKSIVRKIKQTSDFN